MGYQISSEGIQPSIARVNIIFSYPKPKSITQLQKFIGMINYYHRYIPRVASFLSPLHDIITKASKTRTKELVWTNDAEKSFEILKQKFSEKTLLTHFDKSANIKLAVDSSNIAIGAVLQQWKNNIVEPLAYFSKKLSQTERKYSTFDRELLAVYSSIKHFRHFLEGREFVVLTDH